MSISVPYYIYEQYIKGVKNQSSHIVEMFSKGCEYEIAGGLINKSQLIIQMKDNKIKDETIKKLNLEINRLKAMTDKVNEKRDIKRRKAINQTAQDVLIDTIMDG
jgi:hypothetical protein